MLCTIIIIPNWFYTGFFLDNTVRNSIYKTEWLTAKKNKKNKRIRELIFLLSKGNSSCLKPKLMGMFYLNDITSLLFIKMHHAILTMV